MWWIYLATNGTTDTVKSQYAGEGSRKNDISLNASLSLFCSQLCPGRLLLHRESFPVERHHHCSSQTKVVLQANFCSRPNLYDVTWRATVAPGTCLLPASPLTWKQQSRWTTSCSSDINLVYFLHRTCMVREDIHVKNLLSFGHCFFFWGGGSNPCPKKFGPYLYFWTFLSKRGPKCPKKWWWGGQGPFGQCPKLSRFFTWMTSLIY